MSSSRLPVRAAGRARSTFRPMLEPLEDRCLPSVSFDSPVATTPDEMFWRDLRLAQIGAQAGSNPSVVFLGDSILDLYQNGAGARIWNSQLGPFGAADFAVFGNTAENVMWQVATGELYGMAPRAIVLMVGINDLTAGETPEQTASNIAWTVSAIQFVQPQAQILLLGILPAGWSPQTPLRAEITQTNSLLANLDNGTNVHYVDLGSSFLQSDGSISPNVLFDGLHPTNQGYQTFTSGLVQNLNPLLANSG